MGPSEFIGLGVLAIGIVVAGWSAGLTLKFQKGGALLEAMAQVTFLPEKRKNYLRIIAVEGNFLLDATLVWALAVLGVVPPWLATPLLGVLLGGGAVCVGSLTWLGLRPARLTEADRIAIRDEAPRMLASLAFGVYATPDADDAVGRP
jgi:hypothetical protein